MSAAGAALVADAKATPHVSLKKSLFDLTRLSRQESLSVVVVGLFLLVPEGIDLGYHPYSPVVLIAGLCTGAAALLLVLIQRAIPVVGAVLIGFLVSVFVDIYFIKPWYLVAGVTIVAIFLAMSRFRRPFLSFFAAFTVIFSTLVFINRDTSLLSPDRPGWDEDLRSGTSDRPAVIHLVLDELMGTRGLREVVGVANAEVAGIEGLLVGDGFRVYRNARSLSKGTRLSFSNFLTGKKDEGNVTRTPPTADLSGYRHYLKENRYFDALMAAGYPLHSLHSSFMRLCPNTPLETVACRSFGFEMHGALADLHSTSFRHSLEAYLLALGDGLMDPSSVRGVSALTMIFGPKDRIRAPRTGHLLASLELFDRITAEIANAKRGQVYFAHLLAPHRPWVMGPDCMIVGGSARSKPQQYWDQFQCVMTEVKAFLEAIDSNPELDDAIILIQGDHGARINNTDPDPNLDRDAPHMLDVYNAFVAIRAPEFPPGVDDDEVALADVVGWVPRAVGADMVDP